MGEKICCIVPFYNEEKRISAVLEVLRKINKISPIICVDDGSTDKTSEVVRKKYPEIILISSKINQGKAMAIAKGLKLAKGEYTLLVDADLRELQKQEIENCIDKIINDREIDMIILKRQRPLLTIARLFRGNTIISGERILRKKDLAKILQNPSSCRQLEVAINQYMMKGKKKVFWMPNSAGHVWSFQKMGFKNGLKKEIRMVEMMIAQEGPINLLKQILFFCRKKTSFSERKEIENQKRIG